jgi:predicted transport protein
MKLYSTKEMSLNPIPFQEFKLEKEIQVLVEANLPLLFNLDLVKSELKIRNFRIDTLCFDRENKAFVIVEYKRDKNFSVIDQGYTYLSLMLNNKSDFILEYNENCDDNLKRNDIDWSQSRVIFLSPQFTEYQKNSINFKDVPFELWEIKRFQGGLIGFIQHKTSSEESISTISTGKDLDNIVDKVSSEIIVYNEDIHFSKTNNEVIEMYKEIKDRVLGFGSDITIVPRQKYIAFKRSDKNFWSAHFLKKELWTWINMKKGELEDTKNITRDVSQIGHYGVGDYELSIKKVEDIDYAIQLIFQAYKKQGL